MTVFDLVGLQINITDDWPPDKETRQILRQCSDYVEIVSDLRECTSLAFFMTRDTMPKELELAKGMPHGHAKMGAIARSIESSLLSKYARCFIGSQGRIKIEKQQVKPILSEELFSHHIELLDRRDKVIAHAESVEGRQPLRVLNHSDDAIEWKLDGSGSNDFIPGFSQNDYLQTSECCRLIANDCYSKAENSFRAFTQKLSDEDIKKIREGHYSKDTSGKEYPIAPPATSRK